jgi:Spy/CpxP family protein refolding chaperone
MWDNVVAQGKAARDAGRANHQKVKDALQAQLATAEPDLAAVAAVADGVEQQNRALRKQVRDQWLVLYATFSPAQKAVVRDLLQKKVARTEAFHQRMLERMHERLAPSGS